MALTARQRSTLFERFAPIVGEEEAEALLSQFPTNDLEVPATKDFVRAEVVLLRTEIKGDIADLRTEIKGDIADLRTEMAELRTEMATGFTTLEATFHREMRLQLLATLTFVAALMGAFRFF